MKIFWALAMAITPCFGIDHDGCTGPSLIKILSYPLELAGVYLPAEILLQLRYRPFIGDGDIRLTPFDVQKGGFLFGGSVQGELAYEGISPLMSFTEMFGICCSRR